MAGNGQALPPLHLNGGNAELGAGPFHHQSQQA
jgi:hypothetical protein